MRTLLFVLLLAGTLSSCTVSGPDSETTRRKHSSEPDIRLNPNPVRAHRIKVTLEDAPGPFQKVEGFAHYAGQYEKQPGVSCGYKIWGVGKMRLQQSGEFELKQVSESVYEGIAYSDHVLDEDYGKGLCQWYLTGVGVLLRANDNLTDTRFSPSLNLMLDPVPSSKTYYFWDGRYPRTRMDGFVEHGYLDKAGIKSELHDELFTITISIKEMP